MKYTIQINKNIPSGLKLTLEPENKIISTFFHSIGLEDFTKVLDAILLGHGRGFNFVGFMFYKEIDEEDKKELKIGKNDVLIYEQQLGEEIISKEQFYEIIYDYAEKVIEYSSIINCPMEFKSKIESRLELMKENKVK